MESDEPEPDPKCARFFLIPQRYIMGIMASLAIFTGYTMRVSLSMAITEMVPYYDSTSHNQTEGCPEPEGQSIQTVKEKEALYDWNEQVQGLILSSFYWGYIVSHVPGGVISEYYGAKHVLGIGIFINAILTVLTPQIIRYTKGNWGILVALRILEGIGQGPIYPAVNSLMGQWVPLNERSFITNIAYSGAFMGTILANGLSGLLIAVTKTWDSVFYFFGGAGVLWFALWQPLCYSKPTSHPCISVKERTYLRSLMEKDVTLEEKTVPWRYLLTSIPLWSLVIAEFGHDWGWFTLVTDLPKYMKSVLKFTVSENAVWSSVPFAVLFVSNLVMGFVADWLINKNYLSVGAHRKVFTVIGFMGPGSFLVFAAYVGCNKAAAVAMFTIGMGMFFGFFCGTKVNVIDIAPNFAGTSMGIVNGLGVPAGMVAPWLVGVLAPEQTLQQWTIVFWIACVVLWVSGLIFIIFGSGEVQPWNDPNYKRESRRE